MRQDIYSFQYKICENGHKMINDPGSVSQKYCRSCGAPFITSCPKCNHPLSYTFKSPVYLTSGRPVNVPKNPGACTNCGNLFPWALNKNSQGPASRLEAVSIIINICNRFYLVTRQLRDRYSQRETLDVEDEYDVQDLIHALLHLSFSDIRKEEWTPSYAGGSSRMDFLIQQFNIVIETKKTRKGLGEKELGRQLIDDIVRYKKHPSCCFLICFIYDPEYRISNPKGFISDLEKIDTALDVKVIISPM